MGVPWMTADRFFAKTERAGACLIWQGKGRVGAYGTAGFEGRQWLAHRLSFRLAFGEDPGSRVVRHSCDTPLCVEPTHLSLGSTQDNIDDKVARRRHRFGAAHPMRKVSGETVEKIRTAYAGGAVLQRDLAAEFGISRSEVSRICRGDRWARSVYVGG